MRCHTCGSLFSSGGNSDCAEFDAADPSQRSHCGAGEVCLLYFTVLTVQYCTVLHYLYLKKRQYVCVCLCVRSLSL